MPASNVVVATMANGVASQVIGPNARRTRLMFTGSGAGVIALRPDAPGAAGDGLLMGVTGSIINLSLAEHGDIVQRAWFGLVAANTTLGILETIE